MDTPITLESGQKMMRFAGQEAHFYCLPKSLQRRLFKLYQQHIVALPVRMLYRHFKEGMRPESAICVQAELGDFRWPEPPDVSWFLVVCHHEDGAYSVDAAHPVSRMFWSEHEPSQGGPLPEDVSVKSLLNMGFEYMRMFDCAKVGSCTPPALQLVSSRFQD